MNLFFLIFVLLLTHFKFILNFYNVLLIYFIKYLFLIHLKFILNLRILLIFFKFIHNLYVNKLLIFITAYLKINLLRAHEYAHNSGVVAVFYPIEIHTYWQTNKIWCMWDRCSLKHFNCYFYWILWVLSLLLICFDSFTAQVLIALTSPMVEPVHATSASRCA